MQQLYVFAIVGKFGSCVEDLWLNLQDVPWIDVLEDVNAQSGVYVSRCRTDNVDMFMQKFGDAGRIVLVEDDDYTVLTGALHATHDFEGDYAAMCRRYVKESLDVTQIKEKYARSIISVNAFSIGNIREILTDVTK